MRNGVRAIPVLLAVASHRKKKLVLQPSREERFRMMWLSHGYFINELAVRPIDYVSTFEGESVSNL